MNVMIDASMSLLLRSVFPNPVIQVRNHVLVASSFRKYRDAMTRSIPGSSFVTTESSRPVRLSA